MWQRERTIHVVISYSSHPRLQLCYFPTTADSQRYKLRLSTSDLGGLRNRPQRPPHTTDHRPLSPAQKHPVNPPEIELVPWPRSVEPEHFLFCLAVLYFTTEIELCTLKQNDELSMACLCNNCVQSEEKKQGRRGSGGVGEGEEDESRDGERRVKRDMGGSC